MRATGSAYRRDRALALVLPVCLLLLTALASCRAPGFLPSFDDERAFRDLRAQVAFGPRVPGTEAHAKCLAFLRRSLEEAGGKVTVQAVSDTGYPVPGIDTLRNVRARFGPASGPYVVLGAHWDSRPWSDRDPDPSRRQQPVMGANDGASGVAVLLEVARELGRTKPPVGVEIVLFDGEDGGNSSDPASYCRGSQVYVYLMEHPHPLHVIVVDMVGRRGLTLYQEINSRQSAPNLVDRLWEGARKVHAPAFRAEAKYEVFDDHVSFLREGIPAVDVIDLDDPNWHTSRDLPEACDPKSLGQVGRVLLWHVYTLEVEGT